MGPDKWAIDYRDKNRINCYDTGTAPCKTACPAHIAVQGYLKMAAQGRYRDALALIKKENPFPAVCGASATAGARTPAPAAPWIRLWPSTPSRSSLPSRT